MNAFRQLLHPLTHRVSEVHRVPHQRAVTQVQAIEGADADHASVRVQFPALDVSE